MKRVSPRLLMLTWLLVLSCAATHNVAADSLVPNGGFEDGVGGWTLYIPAESKDKNCSFNVVSADPHSGLNCVKFQSDDFARFGIGTAFIPVQPGDHYHVSVWVRADPAAQARPKTPGFVVRLYLKSGDGDATGGHLFIGLGNHVTRNTPFAVDSTALPTTWTQVEAVVEIPPGVDAIGPALFSWWTQGTLLADDFSIEKVEASVPVTPVTPDPSAPATK